MTVTSIRGFSAAAFLCAIGSFASAQMPCLPIDQVQLEGVHVLSQAEIDSTVAPYAGRCLGLSEFDQVLEALTLKYVDQGYILSRAYLPEQDLTTGILRLEVVEGELTDIRVNGQSNTRWMANVFPGQTGKPVNIRDVEQGLDQVQSMPRWQASMEFAAGAEVGETILEVTAETPRRWGFSFSTNNHGNEQSGVWNSQFAGDFTNITGSNDTLSWSFGKTLDPGPMSFKYDGDTNRNAGLSYAFPFGRLNVIYDYAWTDYRLTIPGAISPIETDGWSRTQSLTTKYLLFRDQTTKYFLTAKLTKALNANYIQDTMIEASSRTLSYIKFGYSVLQPLGTGSLSTEIYSQKGLDWFGAVKASDLPNGSPNPQFLLLGYSVDYVQSIGGPESRTTCTSTLSGQFSKDRLFGGQGFSIGGVTIMNGSKIALASGSSGVLWRNEVEHQLSGGNILDKVAFYTALDIGRVFEQSSLDINEAIATGGAVGLKLRDTNYTFDVSYQEILRVSDELQKPGGEFLVSLEMRL